MNVCFLFGINGVGKSTLARRVAAAIPRSTHMSASETLRDAFGGITRAELERIDPARKRMTMRAAMAEAFRAHRDAALVLCDAHLVVPIRSAGEVRHEHMEGYACFMKHACYVTAPLNRIRAQRISDAAETGRIRHVCPEAMAQDERINAAAFKELFGGRKDAHVIVNDGNPDDAARKILRILSGPESAFAASHP